jgi:DsbC/DsbD-like thiol-disulfide interchange protein
MTMPLGGPRLALAALALAALLASPADATRGPEHRSPEGSVRLVSAWTTAPAGGDPRLGVAFDLAPGWHVYWKNPGDAGYPPGLRWAEGAPIEGGELLYPAPARYELPGGLVAFGYEGRMIYPVDATHRAAAPPSATGSAELRATLDYLVCADACVPYSVDLALELPLGTPAEDPAVAAELAAWRERLPAPASELGAVEARLSRGAEGALELRLTLPGDGLRAAAPELFLESHPRLEFERARFVATGAGPGFVVPARALDATRPLPDPVEVAWTATGFERAGRPVAWEGVASLAPPGAGGAPRGPLLALAAVAALGALAFTFRRTLSNRFRPEVSR